MTYSEEDKVRLRIITALRDSFPDRADAMSDQVTRWFTRHWRNPSADPIPADHRCRLCDVSRRFYWRDRSGEVGQGPIPLCSDCVRDAYRLASDDRYPSRDLVRVEALRALRAEGLDESARFVEQLASAFPDLSRDEGPCASCAHIKPVVRGVRAKLCAACLKRFRGEFDLEQQR